MNLQTLTPQQRHSSRQIRIPSQHTGCRQVVVLRCVLSERAIMQARHTGHGDKLTHNLAATRRNIVVAISHWQQSDNESTPLPRNDSPFPARNAAHHASPRGTLHSAGGRVSGRKHLSHLQKRDNVRRSAVQLPTGGPFQQLPFSGFTNMAASPTASGREPTLEVITGVPAAMASSGGKPNPS